MQIRGTKAGGGGSVDIVVFLGSSRNGSPFLKLLIKRQINPSTKCQTIDKLISLRNKKMPQKCTKFLEMSTLSVEDILHNAQRFCLFELLPFRDIET